LLNAVRAYEEKSRKAREKINPQKEIQKAVFQYINIGKARYLTGVILAYCQQFKVASIS